jgi:hypothetical protein
MAAQQHGVPAGGPGEATSDYVNENNGGNSYMLPGGAYLMDTSSGGGGGGPTAQLIMFVIT